MNEETQQNGIIFERFFYGGSSNRAPNTTFHSSLFSEEIRQGEISEETLPRIQRSACEGDPSAMYRMGLICEFGYGVPKSYEQSVKWYRAASEEEYARAQTCLAECYKEGLGVESSIAVARYWYRQAAMNGDPAAVEILKSEPRMSCLDIGSIPTFHRYIDMPRIWDPYECILIPNTNIFYRESANISPWQYQSKVEQSIDADQFYMLGLLYAKGIGCEKSPSRAADYFQVAADKGYIDAIYNLGMCYIEGIGRPLLPDRGAKYIELAAIRGLGNAQYRMGLLYYNGTGVSKSFEKAVAWFKKASEHKIPEALMMLGFCYYNGQGVQQSFEQSAYYFLESAKLGCAESQYRISLCYAEGKGVAHSETEADKWLRKAAEQNHADAQKKLHETLRMAGVKTTSSRSKPF